MVRSILADGSERSANTTFTTQREIRTQPLSTTVGPDTTTTTTAATTAEQELVAEMYNVRDTSGQLVIYSGEEVVSFETLLFAEGASFPRSGRKMRFGVITNVYFSSLEPGMRMSGWAGGK